MLKGALIGGSLRRGWTRRCLAAASTNNLNYGGGVSGVGVTTGAPRGSPNR